MRSRAVSLPPARWRASRSGPPPSSATFERSLSSSSLLLVFDSGFISHKFSQFTGFFKTLRQMVKLMQMPPVEKITSRENRRLVAARRVRDGQGGGLIFIEGKRLVAEALTAGLEIEEVFASDHFDDSEFARSAAARARHAAEMPEALFRTISDTKNPQGIALIARKPSTGPSSIRMFAGVIPLAVCLFRVNNPSNLGAVIRTAEAAGAAGVITTEGSADPFSPKALRAAMGATFRLPIWDDAAMHDVIEWARQHDLVVSTAARGEAKRYLDVDWTRPRLLVLGSEAHGVDAGELGEVDEQMCIPIEPAVESLNLAVAAGVLLFEARRQIGTVG